jgi:CheY-like chemotaxis protein
MIVPTSNEKPSAPAELPSRLQAALLPKQSTILIAEDDPVSARILEAALLKLGYQPVIARHGLEAWERFDEQPVRVIVSDWMMPRLDGLALCEKVRARAQTPYTYFILLTANQTSSHNYELASAAGVDE